MDKQEIDQKLSQCAGLLSSGQVEDGLALLDEVLMAYAVRRETNRMTRLLTDFVRLYPNEPGLKKRQRVLRRKLAGQ